jgi:pilus assembly protein CpaC
MRRGLMVMVSACLIPCLGAARIAAAQAVSGQTGEAHAAVMKPSAAGAAAVAKPAAGAPAGTASHGTLNAATVSGALAGVKSLDPGSAVANAVASATKAAQPAAPAAAVMQVRPILSSQYDASKYGNFQSESPVEQVTHITVGRSIFIDTKRRLARVYITNPEIVDSYTASPNQVVVTAKKAGATTVILWDESGSSKSYLISSDLNVDALRDSMKQAMPAESIKVSGDEGRVVLTGTVGTKDAAEAAVKIATLYSKDVSNSMMVNTSRVKQVRLEVKIVEADRTKLSQFGFNFFSSGGQNPASTTTGQYASTLAANTVNGIKTVTTTNPLNFSLYVNKFNIGATLQDLESMNVLQILSEPTLTAMSGEKANFLAGGEFPFPIVQSSSTGAPVVTLSFKQYGVKLEFLSIVNDDGTIDLKVAPEVSALDYSNAVSIAGYTIPAISTRRAETEVVLKNGQTFALSGLLDKRTTDLYSRTPGAAAIPVLGELFKSKGISHSNSELIVIVTPTIIDPVNGSASAPEMPVQAIPFLDSTKFDKELPKGATKQ